jgi:hypothetical protein
MLRRSAGRSSGSLRPGRRGRGGAKVAVPGGSQPSLAAKAAVPGSGKLPESAKAAGAGRTKSAPEGAVKVRELPSPEKCLADFGTDICVDDYLVGKFFLTSDTLQGRAKGNLLPYGLRWLPRRLPRFLG